MKTFISLLILSCAVVLTACDEHNKKQQIDYSQENPQSLSIDSILMDTSLTLKANFPISFDSVRILVHPVGFVSVEDNYRSKSRFDMKSSSGSGDILPTVLSSATNDVIRGSMTHLLFEDIQTQTIRSLSDKVLNIRSVVYLRDLAKKSNKHFLFYTLQDLDTNKDNKLDIDDITCLYISNLDGTSFTKITPAAHQLYDVKWENWCSRYYFQTIEDINKDGLFDKRDKFHYFYIDFLKEPYEVVEYIPLDKIIYNKTDSIS